MVLDCTHGQGLHAGKKFCYLTSAVLFLHLVKQQASGQTQTEYCRAQGLDRSYFSMWKRRLAELEPAESAAVSKSMRLIPLTVKTVPQLSERPDPTNEPMSLQVALRNGLSVVLRIPSVKHLPAVLNELARLPC